MSCISVVIPALNEAENVRRPIATALEGGADEVIVVDGGSHDQTIDNSTRAGAKVIESSRGRARQQNAGADVASGDVLLFLHADNWLGDSCIAQLRSVVSLGGLITGCFRQHIDATGLKYRWLEYGNASRVRWSGIPYGDQGIFMSRSLFEEQSGFPDVPLMEDLMLMKNLRDHTWPRLLDGPIHVSARRWTRHGVVRQTIRNWALAFAHRLGVPPHTLAKLYPNHR